MEYCFNVLAGALSYNLDMLEKLHERICRIVGRSLAVFLEPLGHRHNVANLSLSLMSYFGRCSSELAELIPLPHSSGRSTHYFNKLHDFSVTIPRFYQDVYVSNLYPRTTRLLNSLPAECFPLTYDLNGLRSGNSMSHSGCSVFHGVKPNQRNNIFLRKVLLKRVNSAE